MNRTTQHQAVELLECAGIMPSYQRIMVLSALLSSEEHPSADAVYKRLASNEPPISRATVYNTLNLLLDRGVICSLPTTCSETRFDLASKGHTHFYCRKCHKIFDVKAQEGETSEELDGHLVEKQDVVYSGICRTCREKAED